MFLTLSDGWDEKGYYMKSLFIELTWVGWDMVHPLRDNLKNNFTDLMEISFFE